MQQPPRGVSLPRAFKGPMTFDLILRLLSALAVAAVVLFMPRWMPWLSQRKAPSAHDVLAGEHGFDRAAFIVIFVLLFGFLGYLTYYLSGLFRAGDVIFWASLIAVLLALAAVALWPPKRPPNQWHDYQ